MADILVDDDVSNKTWRWLRVKCNHDVNTAYIKLQIYKVIGDPQDSEDSNRQDGARNGSRSTAWSYKWIPIDGGLESMESDFWEHWYKVPLRHCPGTDERITQTCLTLNKIYELLILLDE